MEIGSARALRRAAGRMRFSSATNGVTHKPIANNIIFVELHCGG
jgi:hypothetical protein